MSTPSKATAIKARLRNFGDGTLELTGDALKFYAKTGRFRKRREIVRDIPFAEVESMDRQGNDLSIVWKGTTEMFVVEQTSQLDAIHEKIAANLTERIKEKEKETTEDKSRNELAQAAVQTIETVESLFNLVKNLHGRVDWKLVENGYNIAEENGGKLSSLSANPIHLDLKPLSLAIQEHRPKETAQRAFDVLETLYQHFDGLPSSAENSEQDNLNQRGAKLAVQATYILNDLALGTVVGDKEIGKETAELWKVLDELSKLPGSKTDINSAKTSLDKVYAEKERYLEAIENIKTLIKQQLNELFDLTKITSPQPST